ncbi:MAG: hypothetical protein WBO36_13045 [Saprospiraceae bacterium]
MKIILAAIAGMVLILTVISGIRNRFRPYKKTDTRWMIIAIVFFLIIMAVLGFHYYLTGERGDLAKMLIPFAILLILIDQYRRSRS